MAIKRKDFQKAAAFIHEFLLKLHEDSECAELRDSLNLALLHMQKYYRVLQTRNQEKNLATNLSLTARGLSPMTPFVDAPDKFQYRWINLDSARLKASVQLDESMALTVLPDIIVAAREGNVNLIQDILSHDSASVDDQDGLGRTALTYAVHFNQMTALQCLLENESNPNVSSHDGSTAIHQACVDANPLALSYLLQYGGDFTIADTQGRAPIHWTVTSPSTDCLELLIRHNADVNTRDKDGLSPGMWACRLDHIHHFQLLCQAPGFRVDDADGIERDLTGRTWMHWAVRRMEPLECLQTLLTSDTAAIKDDEGRTVILTAAEMGALSACKIILEIGGPNCVYDRDSQGRNALHLATIGGHGDVVNFLLDNQADLAAVDKFNATPWDYAKNRQLHYSQLIIMSHQRQRLVSNPTSPLPNGMGLMFNNGALSFSRGDFDTSTDFDYMSTRGSIDSMPVTPPHPPKRPRTSRMPVRRSRSLGSSQDRERDRLNTAHSNHSNQTAPGPVGHYSRETTMDRRQINSAGEMQGRNKERLEVSVNTRTGSLDQREEVAMTTDDNPYEVLDEDIDGVSVGGMDVSDIEDEDDHRGHPRQQRGQAPPQPRSRAPGMGGPPQRPLGPGGAASGPGPRGQQGPPGPQPSFHQPAPPQPRYAPRPPAQNNMYSQNANTQQQQSSYRRSGDYADESPGASMDMQPRPPMRSSNPAPGAQRDRAPAGSSNYYNRSPSPTPQDSNRPRPAPRPPRMQPSPPKPQPRQTPSPPVNRPGSGPNIRDQLTSPPSGDQSGKDTGRGDSTGKPPGMLEGKKILPPPMLMPLENAPKPNLLNVEKQLRKKKKKKRDRSTGGEKDMHRELDVKSPPELPENLTPPRGFAAPLHPPPSATARPPRAQSGIPSPKYSKGAPQKHDAQRFTEESMEEERDISQDSSSRDDKPPMVNGQAVPIREAPSGPARSARPPGKRTQPMETGEEYDSPGHGMNGNIENGVDALLKEHAIQEDEDVGPLIPPPQGFRGPSSRPGLGRPLSQSVPQDSRSNAVRSNSAKPPLPRGRPLPGSSALRYKNPSPPRRPGRTSRGERESSDT